MSTWQSASRRSAHRLVQQQAAARQRQQQQAANRQTVAKQVSLGGAQPCGLAELLPEPSRAIAALRLAGAA